MSFIRSLPSSERVPMKIGRMAFLRGYQSSREMLTKGSEDTLTRFAVVYPDLGRGLFKSLARLGGGVKSVVFPQSLLEIQNLNIVTRFNTDTPFARTLLTPEGAVDFTKAGVKRQPEVRDLTADFEELKLLEELKKSFKDETNLKVIKADPEIRDLNLYQDLWMVRALLYRLEGEKAAAKKVGNETLICQSRASIVAVAGYLEELTEKFPLEGVLEKIPEEFPYGFNSPAIKLVRVAELLKQGNTSPADNSLRVLTEKINEEIKLLEKVRVAREWRTRKPITRQPKKPIEEALIHLAKRRYKVSFSADGMWVLPQGGFKSAGVVKQKRIIGHRVPADKVIRREQHKIDNITRQISINASFQSLLGGFERAMRAPDGIDYEQVKNGLAKSYLAYEKGIVSPKFRTRLFIKVALDLVATAEGLGDESARARLLKFAADMCEMSAKELVGLNRNLGEQLDRIVPKHALVSAIIAGNLVRDADLRSFAESILISISSRNIFNDEQLPWILRQAVIKSKEALGIDADTEPGIKSVAVRLDHLTNLFAMLGRLNREKEAIRAGIREAREGAKVKIRVIRGRKDWGGMASLLNDAVRFLSESLAKLAKNNQDAVNALEIIEREALLLIYDVEHKHEERKYQDEGRKAEILSVGQEERLLEHGGEFKAIRAFNSGHQTVWATTYAEKEGLKDVAVGLAHPYDIRAAELRVEPKKH